MLAISGSDATTIHITPSGQTHMSSSSLWYRLLGAWVDLLLSGKISLGTLNEEASRWSQAIHDDNDAAARQLLGHICLASDEPSCPCDPYADNRCGHPALTEAERCQRLVQILTA